jgi:hypothetical protein
MEFLLAEPSRVEALGVPMVPIKSMQTDAADMERRYLELLALPGRRLSDNGRSTDSVAT